MEYFCRWVEATARVEAGKRSFDPIRKTFTRLYCVAGKKLSNIASCCNTKHIYYLIHIIHNFLGYLIRIAGGVRISQYIKALVAPGFYCILQQAGLA